MTTNSDIYEARAKKVIKQKLADAGLGDLIVELRGGNNCHERDIYVFSFSGVILSAVNAKMPKAFHATMTFTLDRKGLHITEREEQRFTVQNTPTLIKILDHLQNHIDEIRKAEEISPKINYAVPPMDGMSAEQWNAELAQLASEQFQLCGEKYIVSGTDMKTCILVPTSSAEELARNFNYALTVRRKQNGPQKIVPRHAKPVTSFLERKLPGAEITYIDKEKEASILIKHWDKIQKMAAVDDLGAKDGSRFWGIKADVDDFPMFEGKADENGEITFLIKDNGANEGIVNIRGKTDMNTVQLQLSGKATDEMQEHEDRYWSEFIDYHRAFC